MMWSASSTDCVKAFSTTTDDGTHVSYCKRLVVHSSLNEELGQRAAHTMLAAPHSSLRKISMRVAMRAHNDQINFLVTKERVGITVVLHMRVVHGTVFALWR